MIIDDFKFGSFSDSNYKFLSIYNEYVNVLDCVFSKIDYSDSTLFNILYNLRRIIGNAVINEIVDKDTNMLMYYCSSAYAFLDEKKDPKVNFDCDVFIDALEFKLLSRIHDKISECSFKNIEDYFADSVINKKISFSDAVKCYYYSLLWAKKDVDFYKDSFDLKEMLAISYNIYDKISDDKRKREFIDASKKFFKNSSREIGQMEDDSRLNFLNEVCFSFNDIFNTFKHIDNSVLMKLMFGNNYDIVISNFKKNKFSVSEKNVDSTLVDKKEMSIYDKKALIIRSIRDFVPVVDLNGSSFKISSLKYDEFKEYLGCFKFKDEERKNIEEQFILMKMFDDPRCCYDFNSYLLNTTKNYIFSNNLSSLKRNCCSDGVSYDCLNKSIECVFKNEICSGEIQKKKNNDVNNSVRVDMINRLCSYLPICISDNYSFDDICKLLGMDEFGSLRQNVKFFEDLKPLIAINKIAQSEFMDYDLLGIYRRRYNYKGGYSYFYKTLEETIEEIDKYLSGNVLADENILTDSDRFSEVVLGVSEILEENNMKYSRFSEEYSLGNPGLVNKRKKYLKLCKNSKYCGRTFARVN